MVVIDTCILIDNSKDKLDISDDDFNDYYVNSVIASTCLIYDLPLWTHNKKDFRFLDIELRCFPTKTPINIKGIGD